MERLAAEEVRRMDSTVSGSRRRSSRVMLDVPVVFGPSAQCKLGLHAKER